MAETPETPESQSDDAEPVDLGPLERTVSRAVFFLAMATLVGTMLFTEERRTPAPALLAIVCVFVLAKLVIFVMGLRAKWAQTPAVGLQVVAFSIIGWIVYAGISSSAPFIVVALLLLGAALWRRRVSSADDE